MTTKIVILSVICLPLAACAGSNGEAVSLGGFSGSSEGEYTQYSGSSHAGMGWAGSEGGLTYRSGSIADTHLDRRGQ